MQSMEFDNAGGVSHNPSGNLLAANFGSSYTGFEVHNLATNGTGASGRLPNSKRFTSGNRDQTCEDGALVSSSCNSITRR